MGYQGNFENSVESFVINLGGDESSDKEDLSSASDRNMSEDEEYMSGVEELQ